MKVNVVEHLKVCLDVAATRTANWQMYCQQHPKAISFLVQLACFIDEGVCSTLLQLLRYAFCPLKHSSMSQVMKMDPKLVLESELLPLTQLLTRVFMVGTSTAAAAAAAAAAATAARR